MTASTLRQIAKYSLQRGLDFKTLKKVYNIADLETRKLYKEEMVQYFKAIELKQVKPGESILKAVFGGDSDVGQSDGEKSQQGTQAQAEASNVKENEKVLE